MNVLVSSVIKRALRYCGQTGAPGRGISAEQGVEVLDWLNQMLDSWNVRSLAIYTTRIETFSLVPPQQIYTIGTGGDFNTERPVRITKANILLTEGSTIQRLPLAILDDSDWGDIPITAIAGIPTAVYYDGGYKQTAVIGVANLYFYPYPNQALDYEQFFWQKLNAALGAADTLYLPDGYLRAITTNLAVEISPLYPKRPLSPTVIQQARESRAWIQGLNSRPERLKTDVPRFGRMRPYFLYRSGGFR